VAFELWSNPVKGQKLLLGSCVHYMFCGVFLNGSYIAVKEDKS